MVAENPKTHFGIVEVKHLKRRVFRALVDVRQHRHLLKCEAFDIEILCKNGLAGEPNPVRVGRGRGNFDTRIRLKLAVHGLGVRRPEPELALMLDDETEGPNSRTKLGMHREPAKLGTILPPTLALSFCDKIFGKSQATDSQ